MRADNYALSEETKRMRDAEQARLTDHAYSEAVRLLSQHRVALDRVAAALLERETLSREELVELFVGVEPTRGPPTPSESCGRSAQTPRGRSRRVSRARLADRHGAIAAASISRR